MFGAILGAVAGPIINKVLGGDKKEAAPAQQAVAQNSAPSVGNVLNGSGGKVMMEIPAEKAGAIANFIATA